MAPRVGLGAPADEAAAVERWTGALEDLWLAKPPPSDQHNDLVEDIHELRQLIALDAEGPLPRCELSKDVTYIVCLYYIILY